MTTKRQFVVVAYAGDEQRLAIIESDSVLRALDEALHKLGLGTHAYHHAERDHEDSLGRRFSVWRAEIEDGEVWIYEQIAGPQLTDLRDWEF